MSFKEVGNSSSRGPKLPAPTYYDRNNLLRAGYKVTVKSPWHLHVRKQDSNLLVNVWPTAGKYMVDRDSGASYYRDLVKKMDELFNPTIEPPKPPTPEELELIEYRKDPLGFIKNKKEISNKELEERTCQICKGVAGLDEGCAACDESTFHEID